MWRRPGALWARLRDGTGPMSNYPRLLPVRQQLYSHPIADIPAAVREAVDAAVPPGTIRKRQRIALTAGSRGVSNIPLILKTAAAAVRERGGEPFIVPAMGSHGGATAEGQAQLLAEAFEITGETMACPVLSTMEVVELGRTPAHDIPVYVDRNVARADGVLVVNRVKPHTDFRGPYESGLFKMIAIGMGKRAQAESIHALGAWGLRELMPEVARAKLRMAPILGGLAVLEDGYDQTMQIAGLPADRLEEEEPKLLAQARQAMARLPFERLDLLVADRMGKEISGTGMDTNVLGRLRISGEPEWGPPHIECVLVRDLTEASHGNGIGIGLADIATRRLYNRIDMETTRTNGLVSGFPQRLMIPLIGENDREALDLALYLLRRKPAEEVRMVRIRDTAHLDRLLVSESLLRDVRENERLEILGRAEELRFDDEDNLVPDELTPVE
jgi:lactate racemase-like protein